MEYNEFKEELVKGINELIKDNEKVSVNRIEKNNGVFLDGLVIKKDDVDTTPVIYLNNYYEEYKKDENLDTCLNQIMEAYRNAKLNEEINISNVTDWSKIRDSIRMMVVNYEMNVGILENTPHEKFLDLAVVYYVNLTESEEGNASVRITNQIISLWDINEETLKIKAYDNMLRYDYPIIESMENIMKEMMRSNFMDLIDDNDKDMDPLIDGMFNELVADNVGKMYVLSNKRKNRGASGILCEEALKNFANKLGKGFYILPSSIHELIFVPYDESYSVKELRNMVVEVNSSEVAEDEVLSNKVYLFDDVKNSIQVVV